MISSRRLSPTVIAEVRLPGVVGDEHGGPVHRIEALVQEGELLDSIGPIRGTLIVKFSRFLTM